MNVEDIKFHRAILDGNLMEIRKMFKSDGKTSTNLNGKTSDGITPLCLAIKRRHIDVARLLVNYGASVNSYYGSSSIPLEWAIMYNADVDFVSLLIDKGANVNQKLNVRSTSVYNTLNCMINLFLFCIV